MGADEEEVNEVEPKWNGSGSNYGSRAFTNENTSSKTKIHSLTGKTIRFLFKAGVHLNLIEILGSFKEGLKGGKMLWNTTRQLPDPTMTP